MKLEFASFFDIFVRNIKKSKSFTLTGLTTFSRLLLLKYIQEENLLRKNINIRISGVKT